MHWHAFYITRILCHSHSPYVRASPTYACSPNIRPVTHTPVNCHQGCWCVKQGRDNKITHIHWFSMWSYASRLCCLWIFAMVLQMVPFTDVLLRVTLYNWWYCGQMVFTWQQDDMWWLGLMSHLISVMCTQGSPLTGLFPLNPCGHTSHWHSNPSYFHCDHLTVHAVWECMLQVTTALCLWPKSSGLSYPWGPFSLCQPSNSWWL